MSEKYNVKKIVIIKKILEINNTIKEKIVYETKLKK